MEISFLKLINYRNFAGLKINFEPEGALIHGKNGIGKTNLLEAMSYIAFGKSFKTNHDTDLISFSKDFFRIEGTFNFKNRKYSFETAVDKSKKIIRINKTNVLKTSELYKYLKVVYFSPEDIAIIGGAPSFRRNFIDQATSQYSYEYIELLRIYSRILKQRNALLKTEFERSEKKTWDEQFVKYGVEIIKFRLKYLEKFIPILIGYYSNISGQKEKLNISYKYSFPVSGSDIQESLFEHLEKIEDQEIQQERSLAGPHLDDIEFLINEHPARNFGSHGQKRSLAIAARLVQANLIAQMDGDTPVLMFDDVLSDLDKYRAERILQMLERTHQIFITTPNIEIYKNFRLPEIDLGNSK